MRKRFNFITAVAIGVVGVAAASAQTYPSRQITMVIPFAAGGPTDILGRLVGQRMGEVLGQQIIIENVGGAGGMTGVLRVAQAASDGCNIVLGTVGTHAQNQTLYKRPLYNAATDFTPVALIAEVPTVLIVRKDLPISNLKEFVEYAKKNQDKMSYGSAGTGSATHLACVVMDAVMGTHITHVPYRGTGPAMGDLQAGRIDYLCDIVTTAKAQIDGNTVKAIALMNKTRSPALPNVPTTAEQGVSNAQRAGQGTPRRTRCPDRFRRPRHAGLSREFREKRNREMGWTDQGQRRDSGLIFSLPVFGEGGVGVLSWRPAS